MLQLTRSRQVLILLFLTAITLLLLIIQPTEGPALRSLASKTRLGDAQALLAQRLSEEARLRASVNTGPQQVAASRAAMDRAQRNLDRTILKAPFAGRVNQVQLQVGDYAGCGATAFATLEECSGRSFHRHIAGRGQCLCIPAGGRASAARCRAVGAPCRSAAGHCRRHRCR